MYECEFYNRIFFHGAKFLEGTRFNGSVFNSRATFINSKFYSRNVFARAIFKRYARFQNTKFIGDVWFHQASFESRTNFQGAEFQKLCNFDGCNALTTCNFDGTLFSNNVPSFHQAHFVEAPSLDLASLPAASIFDRGGANAVRNYRALKRLAIQGHDTDRELQFFSGEVRSARFVSDWPVPWPIWEAKPCGGFFRFWLGTLYEIFSDFGRSVFRPVAAWLFCILAFAAFYLSQAEVMQRDLALKDAWWASAAAQAGHYAVANTVPCYPPPTYVGDWRKNWRLWEKPQNAAASNSNETIVGGLSEKLRNQTNARAEALHLAFRNAFVVLDSGSDASHRMYGCLYASNFMPGRIQCPSCRAPSRPRAPSRS